MSLPVLLLLAGGALLLYAGIADKNPLAIIKDTLSG